MNPSCDHLWTLIRCEVDDPAGPAGELVDYCVRCGETREPRDESVYLDGGDRT